MNQNKIMLIDGNSILNRAFYALQGMLNTSDGTPTNAVFGFVNILNKYIQEEEPKYLCVAFDLKGPTFRHEKYDGYKANRKGMPDELAVQLPIIKEVLMAMNIKIVEEEGYEADDVIGSLSLWGEKKKLEVVILTGDRDALQLVSPNISVIVPTTRGGKTETTRYDVNAINDKYGVAPNQLIDVKGLMGDASDNIPGVPGVGEKTALALIKEYGSIEELYKHIEEITRKKLKENLECNRELAEMSKELGRIYRELNCVDDEKELEYSEYDKSTLLELFEKLEFKTLIKKLGLIEDLNKGEAQPELNVEVVKDNEALKKAYDYLKAQSQIACFQLIDKPNAWSSALCGIAVASEGRSYYMDFTGGIDSKGWISQWKDLWEDAGIKKYGHNIKELVTWMIKQGVTIKGLSFDTMISEYLIEPSGVDYDLSQLGEKYLSWKVDSISELQGKGKSFRSFAEIPVDEISALAAAHAAIILKIKIKQLEQLEDSNQHELYFDIELPLVKVLADMEYYGFKIDADELKKYGDMLGLRIRTLEQEITMLAGEEFNINSPKQLGAVLFEKLNLPVLKKTKTGYSTDAEVLEQILHRHEIVPRIVEFRQLVKLKSTYADGLQKVINNKTAKIHSSFNQTVTVTGRISSTEPNLQNIPIRLDLGRRIRKVFIPSSEEFTFVDADYSQIELRVLAHITGDQAMIDAFVNNADIHTMTAAQVFDVPPDEVTSEMRGRAKAVNFGIIYGISDFGLSRDLGITRKEAKKYIDGYLEKYPSIKQYMDDIVERAKEDGYVTTLFNRRRYIPELKSRNFNVRSFGKRIALNTPIQGTAADIIKIAMVRVHSRLKEEKLMSRLILQVHDELLIETYRDEIDLVKIILKECMENAIELKVPLIADISCGGTWYEAK